MPDKPDDGSRPVASCSFCGRSRLEVRTLVAGAEAHICNECIAECMDRVREAEAGGGGGRSGSDSNGFGRGPGGASE